MQSMKAQPFCHGIDTGMTLFCDPAGRLILRRNVRKTPGQSVALMRVQRLTAALLLLEFAVHTDINTHVSPKSSVQLLVCNGTR